MRARLASLGLIPMLLACWGCEEQQFVDPDTVELTVSRAGGITLVKECNYIPVLLGSAVTFAYHVEGDLGAKLVITRDVVLVTFEDSSGKLGTFGAPVDGLAEPIAASDPPSGYSATLTSGCTPSPNWPDR